MKLIHILGSLAVAATLLAVLPAGAAMADGTGDTVATFTLEGGSLDITVAEDAALSDGAPGDASVTGSLGDLGISDTRGSTSGWTVSASSSTFVDGAGSASTGVWYDSGDATATEGTVTATSEGVTGIMVPALVAVGTLAHGNNTASYAPTLTVELPASALAGDYQGTVTASVV
jgi:hypothetical protein